MGHRHKNKGRKRGGGAASRGRGNKSRGGKRSNGFTRNIDDSSKRLKFNSELNAMDADLNLMDHGDLYIPKSATKDDEVEDYYFNKNKFRPNSMRLAGLRRNRFELDNDDAFSSSGKSKFRDRKMVFIKAKDNYDPSHKMILKLAEKNKLKTDASTEVVDESSEEMITDNETEEMVTDNDYEEMITDLDSNIDNPESTSDITDVAVNVVSEPEIQDKVSVHINRNNDSYNTGVQANFKYTADDFVEQELYENAEEAVKNDKDLFFVDEEGDTELNLDDVKKVHVEETVKVVNLPNQTDFNPIMTIGKVEVDLEQTNDTIVVNNNIKTHPFGSYIANVMKRLNSDDNSDDSDYDQREEFDIQYQPSNEDEKLGVQMKQKESITDYSARQVTTDIESLTIVEEKPTNQIEKNESDGEPDFGFCEEDFMVNTEEIEITNIRLGYNDNSYYTKCLKLFGDYEFKWVDQELLDDFIVNDLGLPENRLKSYYKYIHDALIPKEEEPEPTFSDIPFSDSELENDSDSSDSSFIDEEDTVNIASDMLEGLDDLVSYSLKYNETRNQEYETNTVQIVGKGRKKKLLVNESLQLDRETIATLQSKLENRSGSKARKYKDKNDFISQEDAKAEDLLKKYPYGLHVLNMKDELDLFLKRVDRDSLSFPPLDPHGNKTVVKFAKLYNMKTKKSGRGKRQHIIIQKVKKTNSYVPNYNLINQLTKQRPIFMRIDVSRINDNSWNGKLITERVTAKGKYHVTEGELVGENAPEIGKDNIGRRMLEKLGWSTGEGLGAHGNKGISEPVLAVVKKSKKGLGHSMEKKEDEDIDKQKSRRHGRHKR